jgi:hypothetical protein
MLRVVALVAVFCAVSHGQDLDGICRLSCEGSTWSGIAISETQILTVAHHGFESGKVIRAEFPFGKHGTFERIGVKSTVVRSDSVRDLSLLSYSQPVVAKVRFYPIGKAIGIGDSAVVSGYVGDQAVVVTCPLRRTDIEVTGTGIPILDFNGPAVSGMSGSGVVRDGLAVGIQFGGNATCLHAVTVESINVFLSSN